MMKLKGFSVVAIIITVVLLAVICVVVYILANGGLGFGGGKGDGDGSGNADVIPVMATSDSNKNTEAVTTQEIEYIEITVHENNYLFNNKSYGLDEINTLIDEIMNSKQKFAIRITDDNASSKAYDLLVKVITDNKIRYIEVSDSN